MSLKVGIVGLPNVGKSTLFNALLKKQQAYVANFPFVTIEPNVGVVPVTDYRLDELTRVVKESEGMQNLPPKVPATIQFVDIAGIIAGAHKGEGLGNKFLSHIREVDAICHVVRAFSDSDIIKTGTSPKEDFEIVQTELALADLQTLEKQQEVKITEKDIDKVNRWNAILKLRSVLEKRGTLGSHPFGAESQVFDSEDITQTRGGRRLKELEELTREETEQIKQLNLLTIKPILVVLNVEEGDLANSSAMAQEFAIQLGVEENQVVVICAKTEAELAELSEVEQQVYLSDLGVEASGLERLAKKAFATLGLITFLTAGEKSSSAKASARQWEVRAWTIKKGTNALQASGTIHTDFINKFIKAEVVKFEDFVASGGLASPKPFGLELRVERQSVGGWRKSREQGKARLEGKDYIVQDGDVVEFKIGS